MLRKLSYPPRFPSGPRGSVNGLSLVERRLDEADLPALLALRAEVLSRLEHPDIYVPERDEEAFVTAHLTGSGQTFGVFADGRLVAYGMLGLPAADEAENLGHVLGMDAGQCGQVAHLASCMILPEYRGICLQRELVATRQDVARAQGRRYCVAMVSLHNDASRDNLLAAGMAIRWVGRLGELKRQLLFVDLAARDGFVADRLESVAPLDFLRQCELTRRGWWGTDAVFDEGEVRLLFREWLGSAERRTNGS